MWLALESGDCLNLATVTRTITRQDGNLELVFIGQSQGSNCVLRDADAVRAREALALETKRLQDTLDCHRQPQEYIKGVQGAPVHARQPR